MVEVVKNLPLQRPRWDVWPLHGKGDAVGGDEDQDDEVKPGEKSQP